MKARRKFWLAPVFMVMALLGALIVFSRSRGLSLQQEQLGNSARGYGCSSFLRQPWRIGQGPARAGCSGQRLVPVEAFNPLDLVFRSVGRTWKPVVVST